MDTTETETKESVTTDTGKLEMKGTMEEVKVEAGQLMVSSSGESQSGVDPVQVMKNVLFWPDLQSNFSLGQKKLCLFPVYAPKN